MIRHSERANLSIESKKLPLIESVAGREQLSPALLRAVIQAESGGRPCAVSEKGALGMMQLMPATAEELGVSDPFDPAGNVAAGARFLKQLLERYGGNLMLALSAYNAGPARVDRAGEIPEIAETKAYLDRVLSAPYRSRF